LSSRTGVPVTSFLPPYAERGPHTAGPGLYEIVLNATYWTPFSEHAWATFPAQMSSGFGKSTSLV